MCKQHHYQSARESHVCTAHVHDIPARYAFNHSCQTKMRLIFKVLVCLLQSSASACLASLFAVHGHELYFLRTNRCTIPEAQSFFLLVMLVLRAHNHKEVQQHLRTSLSAISYRANFGSRRRRLNFCRCRTAFSNSKHIYLIYLQT